LKLFEPFTTRGAPWVSLAPWRFPGWLDLQWPGQKSFWLQLLHPTHCARSSPHELPYPREHLHSLGPSFLDQEPGFPRNQEAHELGADAERSGRLSLSQAGHKYHQIPAKRLEARQSSRGPPDSGHPDPPGEWRTETSSETLPCAAADLGFGGVAWSGHCLAPTPKGATRRWGRGTPEGALACRGKALPSAHWPKPRPVPGLEPARLLEFLARSAGRDARRLGQ
jgi:hypothetical protein